MPVFAASSSSWRHLSRLASSSSRTTTSARCPSIWYCCAVKCRGLVSITHLAKKQAGGGGEAATR